MYCGLVSVYSDRLTSFLTPLLWISFALLLESRHLEFFLKLTSSLESFSSCINSVNNKDQAKNFPIKGNFHWALTNVPWYTDKKENQIFLIQFIRKFRVEQLQSHIWLTASSYMGKYLRISPYMRRPFLIYDFATGPLWISLYTVWGKFYFIFSQCCWCRWHWWQVIAYFVDTGVLWCRCWCQHHQQQIKKMSKLTDKLGRHCRSQYHCE